MADRNIKTSASGSLGSEQGKADQPAGNDQCRCKETSQMTPRELLKLMFNDLSFWKKEKKG